MKKAVILLTGLLLLSGVVSANQYRAEKQSGDVTVRATMNRDPLKIGGNHINIELFDEMGKAITDAQVAIYYFMPDMPDMNYQINASPSGNKYMAVIKPTMSGAWDAYITAKRGEGETQKIKISFDAQ